MHSHLQIAGTRLLAIAALCGATASHAAPDWSKASPTATSTAPVNAAPLHATTMPALPAASATASRTTPAIALVAAKPGATVAARASTKNVFALDDGARVVIDGKPTTAGALKTRIRADLATKAGPAKTVQGGARKLDLAAINAGAATSTATTTGAAALSTRPAVAPPAALPTRLSGIGTIVGPGVNGQGKVTGIQSGVIQAQPTRPSFVVVSPGAVEKSGTTASQANAYATAHCFDKGPPTLTRVAGNLRAGGKVTLWGSCLGDRPGRVEVIGQFPGGKLVPPFTAWDMTSIEIEIPATIRGAADEVVAVSVVTADGKTTPALQAQFVAMRERVDVPDRLWSPTAGFELAATTEANGGATPANPAAAGQIARSLRINPQCSLDRMDTLVLAGNVTRISGFENGPPNEVSVTIDWVGTCIDTTTTTQYNYLVVQPGDDVSVTSACQVAFQPRAWAYCPAGIAP